MKFLNVYIIKLSSKSNIRGSTLLIDTIDIQHNFVRGSHGSGLHRAFQLARKSVLLRDRYETGGVGIWGPCRVYPALRVSRDGTWASP